VQRFYLFKHNSDENDIETRIFIFHGTGHDISIEDGIVKRYIGTVQIDCGELVFHLFEII